jgi:hypothetical protein
MNQWYIVVAYSRQEIYGTEDFDIISKRRYLV